jgi:PTS system beta-glucosides-specific IIC component
MKKNYDELAKSIISNIGGVDNVISLTHCVTRLRFKLKDEGLADTESIKKINGVVSVIQAGGQYQVVIGSDVDDAYQAVGRIPRISLGGDAEIKKTEESKEKKSILSAAIDLISGIFMPTMSAMMAAGLLKAICAMASTFGLISTDSTTYTILFAIGDAFFYFMPVFLGASAAKKFGVNQFLGMLVAAVFVYPNITALHTAGKAVTFFHIPVSLISYPQTVLPIIFACFFMSCVHKVLTKIIPKMVANIFVPTLDVLITVPVSLIIIGPVTDVIGGGIATGISTLMALCPPVTGFVVGAAWSIIIMFGMHFPLIMIEINNMMTTGHAYLLPVTFPVTFAHAGAAFGVALRTKEKDLKETAFSAFFSGIFGTISEPAIYGVNLKYKRPFICACLCSGIGGSIIAIAGGDITVNLGTASIYTLPAIVSLLPGGVAMAIGIAVGFFGSALAAYSSFNDKLIKR